MAQITVISGAVFGSFELAYYNTIGSSEECIVVLKESSVQPNHATVEFVNERYVIASSTPQTEVFLNGRKILEPTEMSNGDMIQLGKVSLLFNSDTHDAPSDVLKAITPAPKEEATTLRARLKSIDPTSIVDTFRRKEVLETKVETLFKVSSLMSSTLNFEQIKSYLFDTMFEIFKPDRIFLLLYDELSRLRLHDKRISRHCEVKGFQQVSRSLIKEAIEQREALLSRSAVEDTRFSLAESVISQDIQSVMCCPLVTKDKIIGALYVDRLTQRKSFTEDDLSLLGAIASQVSVTVENVVMYEKNREYNDKLIKLSEATRHISRLLDSYKILKAAVDYSVGIFNCSKCSILIYNEHSGFLEVAYSNSIDPLLWSTIKIKPGEGYCGKVFSENKPYLCQEVPPATGEKKYQSDSFLICPIVAREEIESHTRPVGVIAVTDKVNKKPFDYQDQELLVIFANALGISVDNSRLFEKATVDSLTKTYTRQFFFVLLDDRLRRYKQRRRPLAIFMIDIDKFKKTNDELGHQAGDLVLAQVSKIIKTLAPDESFLGRYGGDEFTLAVPDLGSRDAMAYAEEIRRKVEKTTFSIGQIAFRATISMGIAVLEREDTTESLVKKADTALYSAKKSGRNRIELYSDKLA